MTPWAKRVTSVAVDGDVQQLYPDFCTAGAGGGTQGELVRRPTMGTISGLTISGDGTNAVLVELYDINGVEEGADVDTLVAITNAKLVAALAKSPPTAKLIAKMQIAGTDQLPVVRPGGTGMPVLRGLGIRVSPAGATVDININASGLFEKYENHGT